MMKQVLLLQLTALTLSVLLSSCYPLGGGNKNALRPPDVLAKSSGKAIVLFSSSAQSDSLFGFLGINFARISDNGEVTNLSHGSAYMFDRREEPDLPVNHTNIRWRALDPGTYVVTMAVSLGWCFSESPEYRFTLAAGQRAYLGNFSVDNGRLVLTDHLDRDVAYFRSHATGGEDAVFSMQPMTAETLYNQACP